MCIITILATMLLDVVDLQIFVLVEIDFEVSMVEADLEGDTVTMLQVLWQSWSYLLAMPQNRSLDLQL